MQYELVEMTPRAWTDTYSSAPFGLQPPALRSNESVLSQASAVSVLSTYQAEVTEIEDLISELSARAAQFSRLQEQALRAAGPAAAPALGAHAAAASEAARDVRDRIRALEARPALGHAARTQRNLGNRLRRNVVPVLRGCRDVERDYLGECRRRLGPQYQTIKSHAASDEVHSAVHDINESGGRIVAQALPSAHSGDMRLASREAQMRAEEVTRLEQSIAELTELIFELDVYDPLDMATVALEAPGPLLAQEDSESDVMGEDVSPSARRRRRLRPRRAWCACLLLLAIAAIVVPVSITQVRIRQQRPPPVAMHAAGAWRRRGGISS